MADPIIALAALAAQSLATKLGDSTATSAWGALKNRRARWAAKEQELQRIQDAFAVHLTEVNNWSSSVQVSGMSKPETVDATLALSMTDIPRRFQVAGADGAPRSSGRQLQEQDLLDTNEHFALLGDPGAGKTTTVKRLIRSLIHEPSPDAGAWSFPVLVVLRDHSNATDASWLVLHRLGLLDLVRSADSADDKRRALHEDDVRIDLIAAKVLNAANAVVFLDGLDEVPPHQRSQLERSVSILSRQLTSAKLIVSCRSGDYGGRLEGFSTAEICALSREQIKSAASNWLLEKASPFLAEISEGAPADLANRPLFLCQMMTVYRKSGAIPSRPSGLCHQMTRLMLQDWDNERFVTRTSRYGREFGVDEKLDFLYYIAYYLTRFLKDKRFDHAQLRHIYNTIHWRFELPPNEAEEVALEIETHTGIIVQVGYELFEFSHLSLQEYLAAQYLVRLSEPDAKLFGVSPATAAVAIALATDPGRSMATMLAASSDDLKGEHLLRSFVTRLIQERPRFTGDPLFGVAILRILSSWTARESEPMLELVSLPQAGPAVQSAMQSYYQASLLHDGIVLAARPGCVLPDAAPRRCYIPPDMRSIIMSGARGFQRA